MVSIGNSSRVRIARHDTVYLTPRRAGTPREAAVVRVEPYVRIHGYPLALVIRAAMQDKPMVRPSTSSDLNGTTTGSVPTGIDPSSWGPLASAQLCSSLRHRAT